MLNTQVITTCLLGGFILENISVNSKEDILKFGTVLALNGVSNAYLGVKVYCLSKYNPHRKH